LIRPRHLQCISGPVEERTATGHQARLWASTGLWRPLSALLEQLAVLVIVACIVVAVAMQAWRIRV
jgi:hypothetical protein